MKFFKSKAPSVIVLTAVAVMFIVMLIMGRVFTVSLITYRSISGFLEGQYSVDGGPWQQTDFRKPINDHFRKVIIKGRLIDYYTYFDAVEISLKNVWVSLKTGDGELLFSNTYRIPDSEAWKLVYDVGTAEINQEILKKDEELMPLAMSMPHTPGYEHFSLAKTDLSEYANQELILEVENPYDSYHSFSNCVSFTLSSESGAYQHAFKETLLPTGFFLLTCFFGIILFPLISFIFGKINYRYLTFGFLCFFWGVYMIMRCQSWYLNYYMSDPVICMMTHRMTVYFFFAALLVYFRANLKREISYVISGITALGYLLLTVTALTLHLTNICDLISTTPFVYVIMAIDLLVLFFLLASEAMTDKDSRIFLISWIPIALTLLIDLVDHFLPIWGDNYFLFGFTLAFLAQIVRLIFDLRQQYLTAVHYHQIQRELYEAKVAVMASQIRPHFMYNALTSIAMMCTIDPPVAQEATVTFAKYLRENMDSLKQNRPVSFTEELDHLKKYLYIEKLRFADKLNIEYDITATDFVLPLISVQPLVENAVKHGVGMKKKGGTVKIATRETETAYEVIISDDGVGFDTSAAKADDGRSHVGMENTRKRLRDMCGGEIRIESVVGEGTVVTIILPKEGQENENTVS